MPRRPRKDQLGYSLIYHIVNRGVLRQTIFHDEKDSQRFIQIIKDYRAKEGFKVYHWCLMGNHYHLVLEVTQPERISKIIGAIQQVYANYYHRRYRTAGHLFGNRFKSQVIDKESYLSACGRYVERNPVRAKLVRKAWKWPTSSAIYYALDKPDELTDRNPYWLKPKAKEYQQWLSLESKKETNLFHSTINVIKGKASKIRMVIRSGRAVGYKRGRPKSVHNQL